MTTAHQATAARLREAVAAMRRSLEPVWHPVAAWLFETAAAAERQAAGGERLDGSAAVCPHALAVADAYLTRPTAPAPRDLEAIRTRHISAIGGAWFIDAEGDLGPNTLASDFGGYTPIGELDTGEGVQADMDRELVLHAHRDIAALLALADDQAAALDRVRELACGWRAFTHSDQAAMVTVRALGGGLLRTLGRKAGS